MMEWISLRDTFRELRFARIFCVDAESTPTLIGKLQDLHFTLCDIDGATVANDKDLLRQLGRLLEFPDYYGENWDAFDECFGDLDASARQRIALLWTNATTTATRNLYTFSSCIVTLQNLVEACRVEVSRGHPPQVELFLLGSGDGFVPLAVAE